MKVRSFVTLAIVFCLVLLGRISAQVETVPSCDMCDAEYVSAEELANYVQVGRIVRAGDM